MKLVLSIKTPESPLTKGGSLAKALKVKGEKQDPLKDTKQLKISDLKDDKGFNLALSSAVNLTSRAEEAAAAILKLREKQEELASKAASTVDPEHQALLNQEANTIEERIKEIAGNATFNDQNVFQATTITLKEKEGEVTGLPNLTFLGESVAFDLTFITSAQTSEDTFKTVVAYTRDGVLAARSAKEKAQEVALKEAHPVRQFANQNAQAKDLEDAERKSLLAKDKLIAKFKTVSQKNETTLINSLLGPKESPTDLGQNKEE
ncbi:MAG: hypothetical protein D6780_01410 [Candidatus Dadabacteria bacterium]|nr:MAG: hypothetical protein D6780_01410 [Candidatus Dadabacteria bacterium]